MFVNPVVPRDIIFPNFSFTYVGIGFINPVVLRDIIFSSSSNVSHFCLCGSGWYIV